MYLQPVTVLILTTASLVSTFSLGRRRLAKDTDLSEALAILQRQRRRAVDAYIRPDLFSSRRINLDNAGDWMIERNPEQPWYEFTENPDKYRESPDFLTPPIEVEPTEEELDDIFGKEKIDQDSKVNSEPQKKKKEEPLNVKGDSFLEKKSSNDNLSKSEINSLVEAVGKLQKQVALLQKSSKEKLEKRSEKIEPATEEDLDLVFGDAPTIAKETKISISGSSPNDLKEVKEEKEVVDTPNGPKEIEEVSEGFIDPETEEALTDALVEELESEEDDEESNRAAIEIAENLIGDSDVDEILTNENKMADDESYWSPDDLQKRNTKRAVDVFARTGSEDDERSDDILLNTNGKDIGDLLTPPVQAVVRKIVGLQNEADNLRLVAELEDLENDVLTDALNEATLGQEDGSVTDKEFKSLQKAIRIEQALQKIKDSEVETPDLVEPEVDAPLRRKRPIEHDVTDFLPEMNAPSALPEENALESPPNDDLRFLLETALAERQDASDDEEVDETPQEVASLFDPRADECPAIRKYSSNCALADLYSLPVDYEARSLCNLHEMCYSCGHSLGVSQGKCDSVYRTAAQTLCDGQTKCVLESEVFLRTMKLKMRYVPHSQPMCAASCTARFLGMV